jgi:hypothetical protein
MTNRKNQRQLDMPNSQLQSKKKLSDAESRKMSGGTSQQSRAQETAQRMRQANQ